MSGFVRAVGTAVAVVGSIALAAGTFGVGGIAAAGLLSSIGTYASAGAALLSVGAALTAKKPSNERQGQQLQFKIDPNGPVPYVMGRTAVGGTVVYRDTYGKDNSYQTFFTVLSGGGPVDAIEAFTADRAVIPFAGTNATGYYAKWLWQDQQLGQTPEPDALTNGITVAPYGYAGTPPGWGPGSKLSGYAAASLSLLFDTKARRYANGEPTPGWIIRGARVYDPRRDSTFPGGSGPCRWADPSDTAAHAAARATWVYSDRPALHGLMWRLGIWQRDETDPDARYQKIMGIGAPIDMIDLDAIAHAANVQDANGWAIGGQVDSQMDKWEVLKLIEQTGGCEAIANGALMSTLVKAPRVPLRTITAADLADGKLSAPGMRARSERINGYRAKFRSEPHGWEMTPIDIVQVPDYVAADGRAKTGSGDFSLCPDPDQCAELAAYEVFDSRELSPIVLPLKPFAMGYRLGDCLTIDIPELGLSKVDAIVRAANRDPGTAICTLTFQTETAAKHPAALGLTGDTPPTPTLTAAPDVINPPAGGAWALVATVSVSSGLTVPALAIIGQVDNSNADAILFEYRKVGTLDWINGGLSAPDTVRREFTAVEADTPYEARVSYRGRGIYSEPLLLAAVDSSGAYADWAAGVQGPGKPADNATNSADPTSPFGPNRTVGNALATLDRVAPIALDLSDVKRATVDQDAALRQANVDRERLAAVSLAELLEQRTQRVTIRDAGIITDPDTGRIYLYGLDQNDQRVSKVEVDLNAVTGQIALRATYNDVQAMIVQAQLNPADAAQFGDLIARQNAVEFSLNSANAAIALKADASTVAQLGGVVQSAVQAISALTGVVEQKVSYSEFTPIRDKVGVIDQTLSSYGDVSSYQLTIRQAELRQTDAAAANLAGMVNASDAAQRQTSRIAEITQQLTAALVEGDVAEARARLALAVRVAGNEAGLTEERSTRADAISAQAKRTDILTATVQSQGETFTAQIASQGKAITDAQSASTRYTDQQTASLNDSLRAVVSADREASVQRDEARARDIQQVSSNLSGQSVIVSQLYETLVTKSGTLAKAMTVLDVNGRIVGTLNTNDGTIGAYVITADVFEVVHPDTGQSLFRVDKDGGLIGRLKANTIETQMIIGGAVSKTMFQKTTGPITIAYG